MQPVIVIEKPSAFHAIADELARAQYIAIDTESNSFYAYYEQVCLIQISTAENDYIVDPLAVKDLKPLGEILMDPGIEKIFHAASNDILGLRRDFQYRVQNLFDTAIACKLLGYKQLGLARILEEHFGVVLNKKWQRFDWGKRPLKAEQLNYARLDTHYLISLRHRLTADLQVQQLWDQAREAFEKASEQEAQEKRFQPESFLQIHGARSLDPSAKRILKALFRYRENEARRRNRAPFRVLSNETLLRLAHLHPTSISDLVKIKGLPRSYHNSRAAQSLLDLIRKSEDFGGELRS